MGKSRNFTDVERAEIVRAYETDESVRSIARRFKTTAPTVTAVAKRCGLQGRREVTKWQRVVDYRKSNPNADASAIAAALGIDRSYIYTVLKSCGYSSAPIVELGRAAALAGLTIEDIRQIERNRIVERIREEIAA